MFNLLYASDDKSRKLAGVSEFAYQKIRFLTQDGMKLGRIFHTQLFFKKNILNGQYQVND